MSSLSPAGRVPRPGAHAEEYAEPGKERQEEPSHRDSLHDRFEGKERLHIDILAVILRLLRPQALAGPHFIRQTCGLRTRLVIDRCGGSCGKERVLHTRDAFS